jgi:hypothetical protein
MVAQFILLLTALAAEDAPQVASDLEPGFKVLAGGQPIDVEIGHSAPWFADMDGDQVKDLLVGQFGEGKLRIYRNAGTNAEPKFGEFKFFEAGGKDASVPFG